MSVAARGAPRRSAGRRRDGRAAWERSASESSWEKTVVEAAGFEHWVMQHNYDSRRALPGWPDWVFGHRRRGRVLVAELKTMRGRVSAEQAEWLELLSLAGHEVYVWRPDAWDEVRLILQSPARPDDAALTTRWAVSPDRERWLARRNDDLWTPR